VVDFNDYQPIQQNFGKGIGNPLAVLELPVLTTSGGASASAVPEPANLLLIGLGIAGMLKNRRCKK
jgi:hypothetical protein